MARCADFWIFVLVLDLIRTLSDKMIAFARPAGICEHSGPDETPESASVRRWY